MAVYTGIYTNDFGISFSRVALPVYSIDGNGNRQETIPEFDALFLPNVFNQNIQNGKPVCEILSGTRTLRHSKAVKTTGEQLFIVCPFRPGSGNFLEFFEELRTSPVLLSVDLVGEHLSSLYANLYARNRVDEV